MFCTTHYSKHFVIRLCRQVYPYLFLTLQRGRAWDTDKLFGLERGRRPALSGKGVARLSNVPFSVTQQDLQVSLKLSTALILFYRTSSATTD